jgi:hypothetical protein
VDQSIQFGENYGLLAKGKSEQANLASNPYRIPISWQKQALGFGP